MRRATGRGASTGILRLTRHSAAVVALLLGFLPGALAQTAPSMAAPRAILIDHGSGRVLLEKNADQPTAPASLAKLMTIALAFEALKAGRLAPDGALEVSSNAAKAARGATMGLRAGETVAIGDLLQGLAVQSANEAAVVLAEGLAGSVPAFVALMNRRAAEIGLSGSRFANPNGLPDDAQRVTMRDMAALAGHLLRDHPERYALFGQRAFTFRGRTYRNRNPLLDADPGADGLKTGQTAQAGYALVASAARGGRRLVLALNGLPSEAARAEEARRLMAWGFTVPER